MGVFSGFLGLRTSSPDFNAPAGRGRDVSVKAVVIDAFNVGDELTEGQHVVIVAEKKMDGEKWVKLSGKRSWFLARRFSRFVK